MALPKFKNIGFESYKPGKSKLSRIKNIIKLSANESAFGASPKVKKEINKNYKKNWHIESHLVQKSALIYLNCERLKKTAK